MPTTRKRPMTAHITRTFRRATDDEREEGARWYADAHQHAAIMAHETNRPLSVAIGVIAVTSPNNSWGSNLRLARRILATDDTSHGYLTRGLEQARRILDGAEPLEVITSPKMREFYRAIRTSGVEGVVIDRHAYDVAVNRRHNIDEPRPSITPKQYDAIAALYERAAGILSHEVGALVLPSAVQATTWVAWRNRFWAPGAWDLDREGAA